METLGGIFTKMKSVQQAVFSSDSNKSLNNLPGEGKMNSPAL